MSSVFARPRLLTLRRLYPWDVRACRTAAAALRERSLDIRLKPLRFSPKSQMRLFHYFVLLSARQTAGIIGSFKAFSSAKGVFI
jgi:hypothetical protein